MIPPKNNLEILINLFLRIYPKGGAGGGLSSWLTLIILKYAENLL
jgi:hypothetical protein